MLVFLNGNNNLDPYGATNLEQMETVGSTDHLNVVVQWASLANRDTRRLLVQKSTNPQQVTSPIVQQMPVVDMGDVNTLNDFISWGIENYPAKHYFLVVWDHGQGWHDMKRGLQRAVRPMDISLDENTGHMITTEQLGQSVHQMAQKIGHPVDLYGSDACLMAGIEIAHEMVGDVTVYLGSEEVEDSLGWPYDKFLAKWSAQPDATPAQIGGFLVQTYGDLYPKDGTFSALDMSTLTQLDQAIAGLRASLLNYQDLASVETAAANSIRFTVDDYTDLGDLVGNIQKVSSSVPTHDLQAVSDSLKKTVIANRSANGAQGLSIWWPTDSGTLSNYQTRYNGLKFDQATHWFELLSHIPFQRNIR